MKRRILWLISITVCLGLFVSCQNDRFYLDLSAFGETFREENAEMFYHEKCDHFLRYRKIYDNPGINGNQYHIVFIPEIVLFWLFSMQTIMRKIGNYLR